MISWISGEAAGFPMLECSLCETNMTYDVGVEPTTL